MKLTALVLLCSAAIAFGAPALPTRGFVQEYDSIVQALAADPSQITTTYNIKGMFAINDGEGGQFHYYAGDTTATNATDCFEWGSGRLRRFFLGVTASRVNVYGSSTNVADNLTISNYFRLLNVIPTLGSGTVAVFDSNGTLTNGVASGFITEGNGITVSGSTVSTDLAAGSNVTLTTNGSGTISIAAASGASGANPTASVGLSAVNGAAITFLRSDGAPALDQSIAPTWTGIHDYTQNVRAVMSVGDTTFVDFNKATQTNAIAGAFALTHATNGAAGFQSTHMRILLNSSGSDQTLTFPIAAAKADGWLTNQLTGAIPTSITNNTMIVLMLRNVGPTSTLAQQTNVMVLGFEYY